MVQDECLMHAGALAPLFPEFVRYVSHRQFAYGCDTISTGHRRAAVRPAARGGLITFPTLSTGSASQLANVSQTRCARAAASKR
jgi:hypothetical protein